MKKELITTSATVNNCDIYKVTDEFMTTPRYLVVRGGKYVGKGIISGGYASLKAAMDRAEK